MADEYRETSDPYVVEKTAVSEIELPQLIAEYISLKAEWDGRPVRKTAPDQETLDFFNAEFDQEDAAIRFNIKQGAIMLLAKVKPIYDAGLLPTEYNDEYALLETFATT